MRLNKGIMKKNSQEEMVGFVLIVVLVTIIALVFLAISIRKAPASLPSRELESFMQSAMKYSSDCYSTAERRQEVKDLIKSCYDNKKCLDGKEACNVLNETLTGILKTSWKPGENNPIKAYDLFIFDSKTNKTISSLKQGNCLGNRIGASMLVSGDIKAELEICS